mmetsp:Transcript_9331/g.17516  ORF Transcript_9331/g.17516 Transcript_9331/m.17516 type:complete len:200 (-) Transcript_9331:3332-3931(-)
MATAAHAPWTPIDGAVLTEPWVLASASVPGCATPGVGPSGTCPIPGESAVLHASESHRSTDPLGLPDAPEMAAGLWVPTQSGDPCINCPRPDSSACSGVSALQSMKPPGVALSRAGVLSEIEVSTVGGRPLGLAAVGDGEAEVVFAAGDTKWTGCSVGSSFASSSRNCPRSDPSTCSGVSALQLMKPPGVAVSRAGVLS